ncbi:MAG: leucine-rich repeat domain-containing protein [Promethearchaeota archaeon]
MTKDSYGYYQDIRLFSYEVSVLVALEHQLGKPIPHVLNITGDTFGFTAEDCHVTGIGLFEEPRQDSFYNSYLSRPMALDFDETEYHRIRDERDSGPPSLLEKRLTHLPKTFGKLTHLKKLNLAIGFLYSLPESFGSLTALQRLNLSGNRLRSLPKSFGNLTQLTSLRLHLNDLTSLPKSFDQLLNLQTLILGSNLFRSIPNSILQLTSLKTLNLEYNYLTSLPEDFGNLINLQSLSLNFNPLRSLPNSFRNLRNLRVLELRETPLADSREERNRIENFIPAGCTIEWDQ